MTTHMDATSLNPANIRETVRRLWPQLAHGHRLTVGALHGHLLVLQVSHHYARGPEILLFVHRDGELNTAPVDGVLAPADGDLEDLVVAVCAMVARLLRIYAQQLCAAADQLDPRPWLDQP